MSLARLAAEASEALDALLQRPALAAAPHQARELLAELAAAPPGSAWVQVGACGHSRVVLFVGAGSVLRLACGCKCVLYRMCSASGPGGRCGLQVLVRGAGARPLLLTCQAGRNASRIGAEARSHLASGLKRYVIGN